MTIQAQNSQSETWKLLVAFGLLYFVWGSTYLAILYVLETLPPFFMAGLRFLIAGGLLYGYARWKGIAPPTRANWRNTTILGGLFFLCGNGGVVWSEQLVPSGLVALLVALVPLWMVLLDWLWGKNQRPGLQVCIGLLLGLLGIGLLVSPSQFLGTGRMNPFGALILVGSTFCWSVGSIYAKKAELPKSPMMTTAMEMLGGGALMMLASFALQEFPKINLAAVSLRSVLALGYLITFGSILAFSAFVWLLGKTTPARLSTYAYVNPVVAVFLGWAFYHEQLTLRMFAAVTVILVSVILITTYQGRNPKDGLKEKQQPVSRKKRVFSSVDDLEECPSMAD
ncbi:MAG: EamA family transporter [Blastocatellia bacterium]|nr:EamA family transporter [Blastocatellia bacterium]